MSASHIVLHGQDTAIQTNLYMSFELGDKKWQLTMSDGRHGSSRYSVEAGDTTAALQCIGKTRSRFKLQAHAKVHSCYEAGSVSRFTGRARARGPAVRVSLHCTPAR